MKRTLLAALAMTAIAPVAEARDLIVTTARPNNLYVFDAAKRELVRDCPMEADFVAPSVIAMSPDNAIAYVLVNRWQDVIGIDIATCAMVFRAIQSEDGITRRSIGSLAVSKDGKQLYTVRNPVRNLPDRHVVEEPEFAVYDTTSGLDAQPVAIHPAPRRSTVMAADRQGKVYIAGHDIYAVDPATGETTVAIANANWDRPTYSPPDVLAFWPVGSQNDEFLLLYSAAKFTDEKQEEIADYVWGYSTVNLTTGATEIRDFASFEVIMFTGVRDPNNPDLLYGVYTQLSKHNLATGELVKRVDLPHTYYVLNISSDGKELYIGGTNDDIGVYDAGTLERIGEMRIPSGGDMGTSTLHVVQVE